MTSIKDLKGYCHPLTPAGRAALCGAPPWHYATEYLNVAYRTDPAAIAACLPEPLARGPEPDRAYVAFGKCVSLWDGERDMAYTNPERTQYRECALLGRLPFGAPGQICVLCWVDNDFTLARGWFMGFPKKLGVTHLTDHHPLNPAMGPLGPGLGSRPTSVPMGNASSKARWPSKAGSARGSARAHGAADLQHPPLPERRGEARPRCWSWCGSARKTCVTARTCGPDREGSGSSPRNRGACAARACRGAGCYRFSSGYTFTAPRSCTEV